MLESGEAIRDYRQSYVTHGTLAADGSNAILVCSALTGTHHRLDFLIGPGKALDPARDFIVATDAIGNGLSTSPSNSTRQPRMRFPRFVLRDMIRRSTGCSPSTSASTGCTRSSAPRWAACRRCSGASSHPASCQAWSR